ncbi:MAG: DHH family phosphoesterase [Bacillota bacterium]|jgi:phosphoesterase RecJ-like protein
MDSQEYALALSAIKEIIQKNDAFILLEHQKPDGDCIGSGLALVQALRFLGKQALLVSHDPHPVMYDFLPGLPFYTRADCLDSEDYSPQVAIFLDCTDPERSGHALEFAIGLPWINVDHHVSNSMFGDVNLVDPGAAATGQLVYDIVGHLGVPVDVDIATCIYVALVTDTGGFRYQNTTPEAMALGATLLKKGVKGSEIADLVFETRTVSSVLLLASALNTLKMYCGGKVAAVTVTRDMLQAAGASAEETEGIIGYPRSITGVEVSVFFKEAEEDGKVHVSFRSRKVVDVAQLAKSFGGGGHPRAAGAFMEGSISEVTAKVLAEIDGLGLWTDS